MKRMKSKLRRGTNMVVGLLLALLGFGLMESCSSSPTVEYGPPPSFQKDSVATDTVATLPVE